MIWSCLSFLGMWGWGVQIPSESNMYEYLSWRISFATIRHQRAIHKRATLNCSWNWSGHCFHFLMHMPSKKPLAVTLSHLLGFAKVGERPPCRFAHLNVWKFSQRILQCQEWSWRIVGGGGWLGNWWSAQSSWRHLGGFSEDLSAHPQTKHAVGCSRDYAHSYRVTGNVYITVIILFFWNLFFLHCITQERKSSPKRKFSGRTSGGHPRRYPGPKLRSGPSKLWRNKHFARTSMTRRRGRPRTQWISENFGQINFGLNFCSLITLSLP